MHQNDDDEILLILILSARWVGLDRKSNPKRSERFKRQGGRKSNKRSETQRRERKGITTTPPRRRQRIQRRRRSLKSSSVCHPGILFDRRMHLPFFCEYGGMCQGIVSWPYLPFPKPKGAKNPAEAPGIHSQGEMWEANQRIPGVWR